jgi:hypothetical protein
LNARVRWHAEETRWYARVGLEPPTRQPTPRISSVGDQLPARCTSPPILPPPTSASSVTRLPARASQAVCVRDDVIDDRRGRPPAQRDLTLSVIPTCHGPPEVWPRAAYGSTSRLRRAQPPLRTRCNHEWPSAAIRNES